MSRKICSLFHGKKRLDWQPLRVLRNRGERTRMDLSHYSLEMTVRDYECDLQGVVNNAVYQNYLEHARHEYLKHRH